MPRTKRAGQKLPKAGASEQSFAFGRSRTDIAEKPGIFDFTLDNAAVRNNAVARTAAAAVIRGHLILD